MTATAILIDAVFAGIHQLSVVPVRNYDATDYAVVCSCGKYESSAYAYRHEAERAARGQCEVEVIEQRSARNTAARLRGAA